MRLHDSLDYHARERPEVDFAVSEDGRISYLQAQEKTNQIANALIAAGLCLGDRVALLCTNSIEKVLLFYACSKAGVVPVPLNELLAPGEWAYIIEDAGAKVLFAEVEFIDCLREKEVRPECIQHFITLDGTSPGYTQLEEFTTGHAGVSPQRQVSGEDDLYQMYTSGTTGRPKGAILPQDAMCSALQQAQMVYATQPGERLLVVAPLSHAAAAVTAFAVVYGGGSLVIHRKFEPARVIDALSREDIAITLLVPAMIQFCLAGVPNAGDLRYDSLRLIIYGGSPIPISTLRTAVKTFCCEFAQGYGMTESSAAVTYLMPVDHHKALSDEPRLLTSAGRSVIGTEIRIVDEKDQPVPCGAIGEVTVQGPQVMRGYWQLADATEQALLGGWLHTGDAGYLDEEGYLYIRDRVKDMIISGGENIYPREVEDVLHEHPMVAEAAVFGIPDEQWGEAVRAAIVVKSDQQVTPAELDEFCLERIARFKRPRSYEFMPELPRNATGKVLKRELRSAYADTK